MATLHHGETRDDENQPGETMRTEAKQKAGTGVEEANERFSPVEVKGKPEPKVHDPEMPEYMIDVETLSTGTGAACFAIGIVEFRRRGEIGRSIEIHIDADEAASKGHVTERTRAFWEERWSLFNDLQTDAVSVREAIATMNEFLPTEREFLVWANGVDFDIGSVLKPMFEAEGRQLPWMFWNQRCMRTLEIWVPKGGEGLHHPLDDARRQALEVIRFENHVGIGAR